MSKESKIKCPNCKKDWFQLILLTSGVDLVGFTCPYCTKKFNYKLIKGSWRLVKERPKQLEEVERFGSFEL